MEIFGADTLMEDPGTSGSLSGSTFSDTAKKGIGNSEKAKTSSSDVEVCQYCKTL